MAPYSYVHTGRLFDLVLPKPVLEICAKSGPGDSAQFHFVSSVDDVTEHPQGKADLAVTTLHDGSWNITNNKDLTSDSVLNIKHVYIIVSPDLPPEGSMESTGTTSEPPGEHTVPHDSLPSTVPTQVSDVQDQPQTGELCIAHEGATEQMVMSSHGVLRPGTDLPQQPDQRDELTPPEQGNTQVPAYHTEQAATNNPVYGAEQGVSASELSMEQSGEALEENAEVLEAADYEEMEVEDAEVLQAADHDYTQGESDEQPIEDALDASQAAAIALAGEVAPPGESSEPIARAACTMCPSVTKDNWNLMKHVKRFHQDHPDYWTLVNQLKPLLRVACDRCGKVFGNPKILLEHKQKVHHTSYGAACTHCGKFFKTEHHMRLHVKYLHLRQPGTFLCSVCPAKFSTKNVLREHVKYSHSTVDRSNKCSECDFVYAFKKQYYEHFTRVHGPKKHTCPYCEYKCATKWYMKKHMQNCAPKTVQMSSSSAAVRNFQHSAGAALSPTLPQEEVVEGGRPPRPISVPLAEGIKQDPEPGPGEAYVVAQDDGTTLIYQEVSVATGEENVNPGLGLATAQPASLSPSAQENCHVVQVDGEKRQRVALTAADGTEHMIELIVPE